MDTIKNTVFDFKNESEFRVSDTHYYNCVIKGLNLDAKTLKNLSFTRCLLNNLQANDALLEAVTFNSSVSIHSVSAQNTIFQSCIFRNLSPLHCNIRIAQFDRCFFPYLTVCKDSFWNANYARFINCHKLELPTDFKMYWDIIVQKD